jgi:glycosyltransferase involved in cell wall biosynthesis
VHFSVVIPLYNKAPFVHTTLTSVFAQSFQDFEIVVVDDGSKDDGVAIVESFGDPRVRVIRQANAGVATARNRGIREARGDWVAFLDADDWWHPDFLASMRTLATQHPEVSITAGSFKMVPHQEEGWTPQPWPLPNPLPQEVIDNLPQRWLQGHCFCTGTVAFKRELLDALQPCFPVGEYLGEDLDLWFRAAECSAIAFTSAQFLCYRLATPNSLFAVQPTEDLLPFLQRLQARALGPHNDMRPALRRSTLRLVADARISRARADLDAGRHKAAFHQLKAAWRGMGSHRWWFTVLIALGVKKGKPSRCSAP